MRYLFKIILYLNVFIFLTYQLSAASSDEINKMINELNNNSQTKSMTNVERINNQLRTFRATSENYKSSVFLKLDSDVQEIIISEIKSTVDKNKAIYEDCIIKRNAMQNQSEDHDRAMREMAMQSGLFLPVFPSGQISGIVYNCEQNHPQKFIPQWVLELK